MQWFFSWGGALDAPLAFSLRDGSGCTLIVEGGLAIGNWVPLQVTGSQGDPDEIVVSRACQNNSVVFELWQMVQWQWKAARPHPSDSRPVNVEMAWVRSAPALEAAVLRGLLGEAYQQGLYSASGNNSLVAIICRHADHSAEIQPATSNATRTLDDLFTIVHVTADSRTIHAQERQQEPAWHQRSHSLQVSVPSLRAEAVGLIDALDYGVAIETVSGLQQFKLLGGAALDVNPRPGNTGDELLLLHRLSNDSATVFSVEEESKKIVQAESPTLVRALRCLSDGDGLGSCVLATRRALIPTIGDANPPSPPGPPPDPCASKCVAPCGTAGTGAGGAWLASVSSVVEACECCKSCCARPACKAWQLCTGRTCAKDLHTCWLKSTPQMGKNAASTSGLRP